MGRFTAIKGISDLDMAYFVPESKRSSYKESGPRSLLNDVRDSIKKTYSGSDVKVDGQVVVVSFSNYVIEVLPCFKNDDDSLEFPDTNDGGRWRITKPLEEIKAFTEFDAETTGNLRNLCKMVRAWKNKAGLKMGGLLIDTLSYNFQKSNEEYNSGGYSEYGKMMESFFSYIGGLPKEQKIYKAPGSNQNVHVKKSFQAKAKKAAKKCNKALDEDDECKRSKIWREVFGRAYPLTESAEESESRNIKTYSNNEEFVEDLYPVDICYHLEIDCEVSQNGFRGNSLRDMLIKAMPLLAKKKLSFKVVEHDLPVGFQIYWKVLNRGAEARRRNQVRGQILKDAGTMHKVEYTKFKGGHLVECYGILNGVCVARSSIKVPIQTNE